MKKKVTIALMLLCHALTNIHAQCRLDYSNYNLVFEENFDHISSVSALSTYWQFQPWENPNFGWGKGTLTTGLAGEYYDPAQVSLQPGGILRLTAKRLETPVTLPCPGCSASCTDGCDPNTRVCNYVSGEIELKQTVPGGSPFDPGCVTPDGKRWGGFVFGMFEVRMKIPPGITWPAVWIDGPAQVNIYEGKFTPRAYGVGFSNFWTGYAGQGLWLNKLNWDDLSQNFHVYTGVWTPHAITFFLDGREICTYKGDQVDILGMQSCANILRISLQMPPWSDVSSCNLDIDYIRVYKPKGNDYTLPYKNDVNFMNHNVFNDNPSTEVSANQKSIALPASDPNTIYYAGTDNNLYQAVQTATDVWSTTEITNPYMASGQYIGGDLTYDDVSGHLFYRGTDNRLSMWGYNSAINYWWVVYVDADFAHTDKLVSTTPGSIALQDGKVFYIGQDKKIHTFIWDPSCSCMVHTLVPYSYGSNELAAGDIFVEGFSGIPDYHVIYKGVDNRLQILGPLTGSSNWHGWLDPTAALPAVSSKPGSVTRNTNHESYYFIGSDDKIHGLIWNGTAFVPDTHIETYSYGSPSLGYPNADYARGNITYEQATDRILYFGYDGRLQYFQLIPSTGDWYHGWIDDYWNTNQYGTWNSSDPAANMPSLIVQPSSGAYFYTGNVSYTNYLLPGNPTINENQNLRYFIWQPCENLNPVSGSNQNLNKLTPQVTAPANTTVHEYKIFPNPVQDNLNIQVVGNHVGSQKFIIQNVEGKQIMESVFDGTATTVDVSAFTPGIYFLNINDGNRQYHYKFIKNK